VLEDAQGPHRASPGDIVVCRRAARQQRLWGSDRSENSDFIWMKIWNSSTGECLNTLEDSHRGEIKLWSPTGECLCHWESGARDSVRCVGWAPDGSQFVIGHEDGDIKLWSPMPQHPERPRRHEGHGVQVCARRQDRRAPLWSPQQPQHDAPAAPAAVQVPQVPTTLLIPPLNQLGLHTRAHGENAENSQDEVVQGPRMLDQRKITAAIMKELGPHKAAKRQRVHSAHHAPEATSCTRACSRRPSNVYQGR
jgi:hypothetical protein